MANNSQYVSQSIPSTMQAGQKYPVSVTMKNIGDTAWSNTGQYNAGVKKPSHDSTVFGPNRLGLDPGVVVAPGENGTYKGEFTGPAALATYQVQFRTVQETTGWYGAFTPGVNVVVTAAPPINLAPIVNAGADQSITLPSGAALSGTATDPEGKPLIIAWTKVSGPGTVTFSLVSALATQATFSSDGSYVLKLTASDGVKSSSDELTVTVSAADDVLTLEVGGPLVLKWTDNGVEKTKSYNKFNVIVKI